METEKEFSHLSENQSAQALNVDFKLHDDITILDAEKSKKITAHCFKIPEITKSERKVLWSLYSSFYEGATWQSFNEDMDEKTHIIVATDTGDRSIQGFSTIKKSMIQVDGKEIVSIYSGDTIIHPDYWGQKALHMSFFMFLVKTRLAHPTKKVFWNLLCNGFRTYLIFSRNIPKHWPRYDKSTPDFERSLMNSIFRSRFGENYDGVNGLVKFTNSLGKLKPNVAPIGKKELLVPEIRFLVERNPGYINGDEICCLGEINFRLFIFYPFKLVKKFVKSYLRIFQSKKQSVVLGERSI